MRTIYLDNHASTRTDPAVIEVMQETMIRCFGNPHSDDHSAGWSASKIIETSRSQISDLISADPDEIIFTSGATESNNLALLGYARGLPETKSRSHIAVSSIEHKCVLGAANSLQNEEWQLSVIPCNSKGVVDLQALEKAISSKTALVSIMAVNNEVGTIQPIEKIAQICHEVGAVLHCDAAQAPLAINIDVLDQGIDMLSLSAHKMHGPRGIGALYVRRDLQTQIAPIMFGGGQEQGLRPGTLATPLCAGFGKAAEVVLRAMKDDASKIKALRTRLLGAIRNSDPTCILNGSDSLRHPGNLNICFPGVDASRLIGKLQPHLAISSGSACTTGIPEPSHVLIALGLSMEAAESSIRIGIDKFSTPEEIDTASKLIDEAVKECRLTAA